MIRFIAVMDSKHGIANEHGIPWQGKVPTDTQFFRNKTIFGNLMMGSGWYKEQKLPLPNRHNLVATTRPEPLRPGFQKITDARAYLQAAQEDVWVGGGAALFENVLDLADELYLTMLDGEYGSTKFFPDFQDKFDLVDQTADATENGITFRFTYWRPKPT